MLDLAIIVILLMGFLVGLRRGFILQVIHLTGFIVAFIVAYVYYGDLAPKLKLLIPYPSLGSGSGLDMFFNSTGMDHAYYNAIAFAILFFAAKIVWQLFGSMLDFISHLPVLKQLNTWGGGLFGLAEVYLIMFILLYIAALLPIAKVQSLVGGSFLAEAIVSHTPYFSEQVKQWWF